MCGIAGVIRFDKEAVRKEQLQVMMQKIKHRGPDAEGSYIADNIGLGFVRLSILDLTAAGNQPMTDATGRYTIIQNGESYNYIELREELQNMGYVFCSQSDTEVILNGYIAWGKKVLDRLNGMFAIAIYDNQEHTLFLARDRFGVKPLYYCITEDKFDFKF